MGHNASCCHTDYSDTNWDATAGQEEWVYFVHPLQPWGIKLPCFHPTEAGQCVSGWGGEHAASPPSQCFFLPLQSVSAQLRVLCHERSAASLLNLTLHHWLVLGAFTLQWYIRKGCLYGGFTQTTSCRHGCKYSQIKAIIKLFKKKTEKEIHIYLHFF